MNETRSVYVGVDPGASGAIARVLGVEPERLVAP